MGALWGLAHTIHTSLFDHCSHVNLSSFMVLLLVVVVVVGRLFKVSFSRSLYFGFG